MSNVKKKVGNGLMLFVCHALYFNSAWNLGRRCNNSKIYNTENTFVSFEKLFKKKEFFFRKQKSIKC